MCGELGGLPERAEQFCTSVLVLCRSLVPRSFPTFEMDTAVWVLVLRVRVGLLVTLAVLELVAIFIVPPRIPI